MLLLLALLPCLLPRQASVGRLPRVPLREAWNNHELSLNFMPKGADFAFSFCLLAKGADRLLNPVLRMLEPC